MLVPLVDVLELLAAGVVVYLMLSCHLAGIDVAGVDVAGVDVAGVDVAGVDVPASSEIDR